MKISSMLIAALVLTAMLLTGCGCRNSKPLDTMPSENTTVPTTMATTAPTTEATTAPTTLPTAPSSEATTDNGNGPLPTDGTNGTENTDNAGENAKSRMMPRVK